MSREKKRCENGSIVSWGKTKTYIDLLLHDIMNRDNAKERSNFQYVSYDWSRLPGWYFWPKCREGVFALKELENEQRPCRRNRHNAFFALYYYPALTEEVMADYSLFERVIRKSELFDEGEIHVSGCCHREEEIAAEPSERCRVHRSKGIPTHYGREVMNGDLFVVASVDLQWMKNLLTRCIVRAPERWRTVVGDKVDRHIPCWELAWFFVHAFTSELNRSYTIATETEDVPQEGVVKSATIAFNRSGTEQTYNLTGLRV